MATANEILDQQFLEMRWRVLSLAADLDRIQRAANGGSLPKDLRLEKLRQSLAVLSTDASNRAERVQVIFSDKSPAPIRNPQS